MATAVKDLQVSNDEKGKLSAVLINFGVNPDNVNSWFVTVAGQLYFIPSAISGNSGQSDSVLALAEYVLAH